MNYRFNKKRNLFWRGLIVLILFVFLFFVFNLDRPFAGFFHSLARPFWKLGAFFERSAGDIGLAFASKKSLLEENNALKELLEKQRLQLVYTGLISAENEELKNLLNLKKERAPSILAAVLSKPNRSVYDILIIDAGLEDGVAEGDKIALPPNILLGEIEEVFARTAKARLYSTRKEITAGQLAGTGTPVEIVGRGGGNFKIILPREVKVTEEEAVIAPPDYLLGNVAKIEFDPREPMQTIYLKSPVNMYTLRFVEIKGSGTFNK